MQGCSSVNSKQCVVRKPSLCESNEAILKAALMFKNLYRTYVNKMHDQIQCNCEGKHSVAVKLFEQTVGHMPREQSRVSGQPLLVHKCMKVNSTMCENPNPNPRPWDTPDTRPSMKYHHKHTSWDYKTSNILPATGQLNPTNTKTITPQYATTLTLTLDHGISLTPDHQ